MKSSKSVVIVDYHLGNLFSVQRACERLDIPAKVSSDPTDIRDAAALILPGVGAFGQAMTNLKNLRLVEPILDHVGANKPFFGICLGLQLLFDESEEFGSPKGLGIIQGRVRRLPVADAPVPQIGWNRIRPAGANSPAWSATPLESAAAGDWVYFVHSYYAEPAHEKDTLAVTDYAGFLYTSAVCHGNVFAAQFHPEKSGTIGIEMYKRWYNSFNQ